MEELSEFLESLIPLVGRAMVLEAQDGLSELVSEAEDPTKKVVLTLMYEAVSELGEKGISVASSEIKKLLEGSPANLSWASPRTASDALAILQNAERDRKKKAKSAMQKTGKVLGTVAAIMLKAAIAGAIKTQA